MSRSIRLFVSSSPDLAPEREVLGQAVAGLPISIGWQIKHTPGPNEDVREGLAFIDNCDLYLILLGADFAAPMGLEWERARRTGRPTLAYRKERRHSPSARSLLRQSNVAWTDFGSPSELKSRITPALASLLLDRGEKLGLQLKDVEGLLAEVAQRAEEPPGEPDPRSGAGRSAVILGRDR